MGYRWTDKGFFNWSFNEACCHKCSYILVYVCVPVYVRVCAYICVACMHVDVKKTTMGVILAHRNSHLIHQVGQTGWLASSKRSSCLHLPRGGPTNTCHHSGLFHRFWGSNSGPRRAGTLETELSPRCLSMIFASRLHSCPAVVDTVILFTQGLHQSPLCQQGMQVLHCSCSYQQTFQILNWGQKLKMNLSSCSFPFNFLECIFDVRGSSYEEN